MVAETKGPGEADSIEFMRQIVLEQPGQFREQVAAPMEANPGEALVRVHRIGVCGTDLHAFAGRQPLPFETSVPGVFAVGDVRSGSAKRVATAVGEGAMAIRLAFGRTRPG